MKPKGNFFRVGAQVTVLEIWRCIEVPLGALKCLLRVFYHSKVPPGALR